MVFWNVMPYGLVDGYQHFGGTYYLHHQGEMTEDGGSTFL
jgi:hypothetical protein